LIDQCEFEGCDMKECRIVLIAHDAKKKSLVEWATYNKEA
jgi:methylglyoxal synthase